MGIEGGKRMTDEEMAKEYLEELRKKKIPFDIYEVNNQLKQSYLAGLKAGRTKWHKVADGDLPSEEGGWVCNQNGLPCFFDWDVEQWLCCEGTQIRTTEWCHMPHKE